MDQPKIERLLRILMMLTGNNSYTVEEIAERLSVSKRTVYRYIDSFRESGFVVTKSGDFVKIKKESRYYKDISHLLYFSEEESYLLKRAIENLDENDTLKQNLKKKL